MNQYVVLTTINPPSDAVRAWCAKDGLNVLVVGDQKTPQVWSSDNCRFFSAASQKEGRYESEMAKAIPWNNYARKMVGYEIAFREKADVIIDTDDDNIPKGDWSYPPFDDGEQLITDTRTEWFNVYRMFSHEHCWPRGFPLEKVSQFQGLCLGQRPTKVGVWQGLVDGEPDVDAIFRLTHPYPADFKFEERSPIVLDRGVWCPFNSQNTVWRKEVFALMYLPVTVPMRCTDIIRSLVAEPIMNEKGGYQVGFTKATAVQKRNPHNLLKDFEEEIPIYLSAQKVINAVIKGLHWKNSIPRNMALAYRALIDDGIVKKEELDTLGIWLKMFL